jgi:hypothetical protein
MSRRRAIVATVKRSSWGRDAIAAFARELRGEGAAAPVTPHVLAPGLLAVTIPLLGLFQSEKHQFRHDVIEQAFGLE